MKFLFLFLVSSILLSAQAEDATEQYFALTAEMLESHHLEDKHLLRMIAGDRHTCVIQADQSLRCWGNNEHGQTNVPEDLGPVFVTDFLKI